ncbi:MAG: hypothetical protein Q7S03_02575 [bacterium]|nr:hypothetical protein [bacterium]
MSEPWFWLAVYVMGTLAVSFAAWYFFGEKYSRMVVFTVGFPLVAIVYGLSFLYRFVYYPFKIRKQRLAEEGECRHQEKIALELLWKFGIGRYDSGRVKKAKTGVALKVLAQSYQSACEGQEEARKLSNRYPEVRARALDKADGYLEERKTTFWRAFELAKQNNILPDEISLSLAKGQFKWRDLLELPRSGATKSITGQLPVKRAII